MRLKRSAPGPAGPTLRSPTGGRYDESSRRRATGAPPSNTFTNSFDHSLGQMRRSEGYRVLLVLMLAMSVLVLLMMRSFNRNYAAFREGANERMALGYHRSLQIDDLDLGGMHARESARFHTPVRLRLIHKDNATLLEVADPHGRVLRTRYLDSQDLNVDGIRKEYHHRTGEDPDQVSLFYRRGRPLVLVEGLSDDDSP